MAHSITELVKQTVELTLAQKALEEFIERGAELALIADHKRFRSVLDFNEYLIGVLNVMREEIKEPFKSAFKSQSPAEQEAD